MNDANTARPASDAPTRNRHHCSKSGLPMSQWVIGPCPGCIDEARPASDAPAPPREVCSKNVTAMAGANLPHTATTVVRGDGTSTDSGAAVSDPSSTIPRTTLSSARESEQEVNRNGENGVNNRDDVNRSGENALAASPAQEATPPREQEQHQGWTKNDQPQEPKLPASESVAAGDALRLDWLSREGHTAGTGTATAFATDLTVRSRKRRTVYAPTVREAIDAALAGVFA